MAKQFLKLKSLAYISRISVAFDPFDATSRGASKFSLLFLIFDAETTRKRSLQNFLMKVQAGRQLRASNPKCEINEVIKKICLQLLWRLSMVRLSLSLSLALARSCSPHDFSADGSKDVLEAANARWQDLIENMNRKRSKLELDDLVAKAEKFEKEKR